MKTNYNNLTVYETCIVIVAIVGMALIGVEIYMSLPHTQQIGLSNVFSMFDVHEEFAQVTGGVNFAMDSMDEFYNQFDIAFEQTFSYPDQIGKPVITFASALDDYSTTIAANYQKNIQFETKYNPGEALDAMLTHNFRSTSTTPTAGSISGGTTSRLKIYKQYYYHAPGMVENLLK